MPAFLIAFLIWVAVGLFFIGLGIHCLFAKKPAGFWANTEVFEVKDLKKYNRAMAKLWSAYGVVFIALGIPLLSDRNKALIMVPVLGILFEAIAAMVLYTQVIERKYRKR